MTLKTLETETKGNGFIYTILKRQGKVALVEVTEIKPDEVEQNGYEVWVIRTIPVRESTLKFKPQVQGFDFYEVAPSNEDFGTYGWYFISKDKAEVCFAEKVEKYAEIAV